MTAIPFEQVSTLSLKAVVPGALRGRPNTSDPERALRWARLSHGSQRYGQKSYVCHLTDVVRTTLRLGWNDRDALVTAALHDVVEDTDVTVEQVRSRFGVQVAAAVDALTRRSDQPIDEYFDSMGVLALGVKLADRVCNLRKLGCCGPTQIERDRTRRIVKYLKEMPRLRERVLAFSDKRLHAALEMVERELLVAQVRLAAH